MNKYVIFFLILAYCNFFGQGQIKEVFLHSKMNGTKTLPNGNEVEFWGYGILDPTNGTAKAELPAPTLRFNQGDTAIIHLFNASPESHTIHWHGLDVDQANDGVGHTSQIILPNSSYTYQFNCDNAGTYLYHCHVLTPLHLAMGMYGLVIVQSQDSLAFYDSNNQFTKEYSYLFSEMNTSWNDNPLSPGPFHLYEADYLMVNGESELDPEFEENNIYALLTDTLGFRVANIGYGKVTVDFPSELVVRVVGSDGRLIPDIFSNSIEIYPGERFEIIAYPTVRFAGVINVTYYDLRGGDVLGMNNINVDIESLNVHEMGIEDDVKIYPIPADNQITFSDSRFVGYPYSLYSSSGIIICNSILQENNSINISSYPKGFYFLEINGIRLKILKN